jgi:LysM repeat protein
MQGWKRLIYYILINIVVSAATVLVVLNVWERTHPPLTEVITPTALAAASPSPAAATTGTPPVLPSEAVAPTEASAPPSETPQPSPTLELIEYQVKSGDTLGSIAVDFDVSVADILAVNTLDNPDNLSIGQLVYIPTGPGAHPQCDARNPPTATLSPTPRPTATPTFGPRPPLPLP